MFIIQRQPVWRVRPDKNTTTSVCVVLSIHDITFYGNLGCRKASIQLWFTRSKMVALRESVPRLFNGGSLWLACSQVLPHRQNMPSAWVPPLACLRRGKGDHPTPCCPLFSLEWAGWGWGYAGPDAGFWLCSQTPGGLGQRCWLVSEVTWPPNQDFRRWGSLGPALQANGDSFSPEPFAVRGIYAWSCLYWRVQK